MTLSQKEKKLIKDSDNQDQFRKMFDQLSAKDFIAEGQVLPLDSDKMDKLRGIIDKIEKERLYKGKGGEIMRGGVCHLIYAFARAKIPISEELNIQYFKTMLDNFKHPN